MEEEKNLLNEIASGGYDASDRPFDFVATDAETALICEPDENVRVKLESALKEMGYQTTLAASARDALKNMRFHLFDVVVVNENFDPSAPDRNDVLAYLETLAMSTRRQIFVALVSDKYRTMDNMAAFNKSVNIVINLKNIDNAATILRGAVADNAAFYHVMKDILKKMGRI
ncbi:MAG: hypothetical protein WC935_09395 [Thermoleophilia bacterium]